MAGIAVANIVQLGDSATATQNFSLQTNVDGTSKLARGNAGATSQDILTVDANGRIAMPQTVIAFSAYQSTLQTGIPNATFTKIQLQTKEYDTGSFFDATTNFRFQPTVPGYYQINGSVYMTGVAGQGATIYKNGTEYKRGTLISNGNAYGSPVCSLVYLNGSSDYVELYCYQSSGGTVSAATGIQYNFMNGILIAKA